MNALRGLWILIIAYFCGLVGAGLLWFTAHLFSLFARVGYSGLTQMFVLILGFILGIVGVALFFGTQD